MTTSVYKGYVLRFEWQMTCICTVDECKAIPSLGTIASEISTLYPNERKSEQAHIPHAPTLLENAV